MPTKAIHCLTVACFASLAFGQATATLDRVFYFTHADTPQKFQEINNIIRSMADTPSTTDNAKKSLTVHGNPAQLAVAEFLMSEMDRAAAPPPAPPAITPYRDERGQDQQVRVFSLVHANTPLQLMELTNLVRSLSDMQRVFPYNALNMLTARGTADQIGMADWLIQQLDRPAGAPPQDGGTRDIQWTFKIVETARVFYLTHAQSPEQMQAVINQLKTGTKTPRLNPYNALHAIGARGSADQLAAVERMLKDLDQPKH